jgi:hypothetical protein
MGVADIVYEQESLAPAERDRTMPIGTPEDYGLITLGWHAIYFGSKYFRQPDGDRAGERWQYVESQVQFLLWWYSLDELQRWVYSHGVRRWPKGAGKSPFAAIMAITELLAPVRLAGISDTEVKLLEGNGRNGLPKGWVQIGRIIGKPVGMPLVQIGATAESQANINTMRMIRALVPKKSRLVRDFDLDPGKTLIYTPGGGQLSMITNSADAAEGALTTFAILDQTEAFRSGNGGVDLSATVGRNVGKQGNRLIETSNSWEPGADSVAETTFGAWEAEQEGRLRGRARTLMDVSMAPLDTDFEDIESLVTGVTYAYGDCYWSNPRDIVETKILDLKTTKDVSMRYYLNWPTSAEDSWTTLQKWAKLKDLDYEMPLGSPIAMFFDGSRTRDASALIGAEIETGFTFVIGIWETSYTDSKSQKPEEIPVGDVDAAVEYAFEHWDVWAFFSDVREWESFAKVTWPERYKDKVRLWAVPGGRDPQSVAWDMRWHTAEFTGAAEMTWQEIEDQAFKHDGDGRMSRHTTNARKVRNRWGTSIGKESRDSPRKIDAAVAMIGARHARRLVLASKEWKEREASANKKTGQVWSFS